ncbi:MAG: sigma-70 family RNA polymerase sigma factor [Polyangiaceae bacterium]|nr:sigma-70 family RNA polymerase sigma factor [Polyangiaceae bacterium]
MPTPNALRSVNAPSAAGGVIPVAATRGSRSTTPPKTFDDLYDDHVDLVWRALRRFGVSEPGLEDAVQEVFIVAFKKLDTFEGKSALSTWLYGIAAYVARNVRRSQRRRPETPTEDAGLHLTSASDSPEDEVGAAEALRVLHALLDELDDDKREVFVLAELEGLTAPEISTSLGVNVNTIYARLRAARAAFEQAVVRRRAKDARQLQKGGLPCR